ncbi:hypothetical protein EMIHUDRAFT_246531 [Emiliania huxleyi CCMP1516]|uniref:Pentacotripeptide-repeat region of PRORP domain-containing protein n=2 Tax=Emiliania huxleyi TaxID=2903 RepID=A0A0D3IRT4_EMIH1|nr:hypothetical protein EMIHUDRAFT_246531 [Emiliania huxleyi CCMP1516]EOD13969.1 hypothetical protein EMIHUDRAFT_246531 [Emiliania huxleyi CCMP1516]|eukprot:XP_005766398.1 hypothetical protein EMIHUDRAFT_246531 [Emiliania huxleyi CCMP1516]
MASWVERRERIKRAYRELSETDATWEAFERILSRNASKPSVMRNARGAMGALARALSELVLNDGGIDATLRWLTAAREPSTAAFVPLIEAAVSCGDDDALLAAGGLMRKRGVRPDAALYTALILGRLRLGQTERALSACDKCLSDGVAAPRGYAASPAGAEPA